MTKQIKALDIPSHKDILDELRSEIFTNMNCINVGRIEGFNSSDQTATISLSIKAVTTVSSEGVRTLATRPVLEKCPCIIMSGGTSHLTFPIEIGDTCLVLFNDRQIDNWFDAEGDMYPNVDRKHDLSDAIALVGLRNLSNSITDYLPNGVRLKYDDSSKVDLTQDNIESTASEFKQNGNMEVTGNVDVGGNVDTGGTVNGGISGGFEAVNLLGDPTTFTFDKGVIISAIPL